MLRCIQALNFRCLRDVDVPLDDSFHILVGPNGSGKSALFDAIEFVRDSITDGLAAAVDKRTNNFQDLVWARPRDGSCFALGLEFDAVGTLKTLPFKRIKFTLQATEAGPHGHGALFGHVWVSGENDSEPLNPEKVSHNSDRRLMHMEFGPHTLPRGDIFLVERPDNMARDALAFLNSRVQRLFLDSSCLRKASPPEGKGTKPAASGANMAWTVKRLQDSNPTQFDAWLSHVRTELDELEHVRVVEREDDRHAYLMIRYANGVEVPSWSISDGTLRLLALTLIAYLPYSGNVYLLEEPENGVHPLAVDILYQSLSSVYDSQVIVATHSPVFLRCAKPENVLCVSKSDGTGTQVIPGQKHPRLGAWRSAADMDLLLASEVLG